MYSGKNMLKLVRPSFDQTHCVVYTFGLVLHLSQASESTILGQRVDPGLDTLIVYFILGTAFATMYIYLKKLCIVIRFVYKNLGYKELFQTVRSFLVHQQITFEYRYK